MTGMHTTKMIPSMSQEEARALLPRVGDILYREPTILGYMSDSERARRKCRVTYVNYAHLWYEVEFLQSGFRQGFKAVEPGEGRERDA